MKTTEVDSKEKEMLKTICEQAPDGISVNEIRVAIKVMDAIDACEGTTLTLEDADHAYLVNKFSSMKFRSADRAILKLFDKLKTPA